jgi:hypothetical protein
VASKNGRKKNFPSSFGAVVGSLISGWIKTGSRIRDKQPGSATLLRAFYQVDFSHEFCR